MEKRLHKSSDKILGGVAGGFADYLDADPTLIRLLYVVLMFVTGIVPLAILYLIAWIIMPE